MKMRLFLYYIFFICPVYILCVEKITYISVEHPVVTYYNPKFFDYFNLTSKRLSRKNPVHYVGLHFYVKNSIDNNLTLSFYFYEFLTNVYKRSFIELHYKWCDFISNDQIFAAPLREGKLAKPCPHPPGAYSFDNKTIPPSSIPKGFPFRKGRIICDIYHAKTNEKMLNGHIDMEIKEVKRNNRNITFSDIN